MTFTPDAADRAADESLSSVLTGAGRAGGAALRGAEVHAVRELIATMILPGAGDTPGSASRQARAEWVDLLGELEAVKSAVAATQARLVVALDAAAKAEEAAQGIRSERRGRGVASQVGAAMRVSPYAGASFLSTARVWMTGMPFTFDALRSGVLSQWRATLLVRETSHLSPEHRAWIDEELCGPAGLAVLAGLGTRRLVARVKELAARLDVGACVRRNARAVSERRVSVRPAPDLMVYVSALVPVQQGVQAYAQLKAHADAVRAAGDERGAGQIMADTLIERVTGRAPGKADEVPVTINLLVSDRTLLAEGVEPGVVVEGMAAGVGSVPAPVARNLAAHGIDADAAWLRSIYVDPRGRLLATTSVSRFHPQGLAVLLRAREQGICASSWCDAPVRHLDHVLPYAEGGETSFDNGQGLCARCNHAKQAPGWRQKVTEIDGRHAVETTTPTGHTHVSVAPAPPEPATEGASDDLVDGTAWTPAVGMTGPRGGRVPRSRYSSGCQVGYPRGAIPDRRPRARRVRSGADLSWV
ncbi:HNH endonuclease [Promicromonospora xylanilytica]